MLYGAVNAHHPSFKGKESGGEARIVKEILGIESCAWPDFLCGEKFLCGQKGDRAKKLDRAEEHRTQGYNEQDFARK